jgi:hypothetical protein
MVQLEVLGNLQNSITSLGLQPTIIRFVAQLLNNLR